MTSLFASHAADDLMLPQIAGTLAAAAVLGGVWVSYARGVVGSPGGGGGIAAKWALGLAIASLPIVLFPILALLVVPMLVPVAGLLTALAVIRRSPVNGGRGVGTTAYVIAASALSIAVGANVGCLVVPGCGFH